MCDLLCLSFSVSLGYISGNDRLKRVTALLVKLPEMTRKIAWLCRGIEPQRREEDAEKDSHH